LDDGRCIAVIFDDDVTNLLQESMTEMTSTLDDFVASVYFKNLIKGRQRCIVYGLKYLPDETAATFRAWYNTSPHPGPSNNTNADSMRGDMMYLAGYDVFGLDNKPRWNEHPDYVLNPHLKADVTNKDEVEHAFQLKKIAPESIDQFFGEWLNMPPVSL
jgi:hypothetical protein